MKSIIEIQNFEGKKVLVRTDWDVDIEGNEVIDDIRIKASFETIKYVLEHNGSPILITHFGRKGESMKVLFDHFKKEFKIFYPQFEKEFLFIEDPFKHEAREEIENLEPCSIIVFQNIRKWKEEQENDSSFAKSLSSFGSFYVNDAFAVSHREHSSIAGIPKFLPSFLGFNFVNEIQNLSKAFDPEHPFLLILCGAKFETKLPLINKFINVADKIFVGGALANNFFKEKGFEVGNSLLDKEANLQDIINNPKIVLPKSVITDKHHTKTPNQVSSDEIIMDAGEDAVDEILEIAQKSKLVVWNGPLGNYEEGFNEASDKLAKGLAKLDIEVIVGGGDTVLLVDKLGIKDKFSFVSTGGGAMLDFLIDETLVGIEAVK